MTFLDVLLVGLASYRVTRLVVADTIWQPTRNRLLAWLERGRRRSVRGWLGAKAAEALSCPFCAGVWITAGVALAWVYGGSAGRWFVWAAAACAVQALASNVDEALGDR